MNIIRLPKFIYFLFSLMLLASCSKKETLITYYGIIDSADKIIYYKKINESFFITKQKTDNNYLQNAKDILKRNIKPQEQQDIIPTDKIEIYKDEQLIGTLFISDIVNFSSPNLKFGFRLTYGIGMSL